MSENRAIYLSCADTTDESTTESVTFGPVKFVEIYHEDIIVNKYTEFARLVKTGNKNNDPMWLVFVNKTLYNLITIEDEVTTKKVIEI